MYVAKDIGYHYWKAGMFEGLTFEAFDTQPREKNFIPVAPKANFIPIKKPLPMPMMSLM